MANPFYVQPANPLQALMIGVDAFKDTYGAARKQATEADLQAGRQTAMQRLMAGDDPRQVMAPLIAGGDVKLAEAIAQLSENQANRTFREQEAKRNQGNTDRAHQLQRDEFNDKLNKPQIVGSAETGYYLVDRRGQPIPTGGQPSPGGQPPVAGQSSAPVGAPDGQPMPAGPQPIIPAKPKAAKEMTVVDRKAIQSAEDENAELDSTVEALKRAREINSQTFTGAMAGGRAWLGTKLPDKMVPDFIADPKTSQMTEEWQKTMSPEALQRMASTLKGATTDFELRKFIEMLADPTTTPETREKIITRMTSLSERKREINKTRMDQLRDSTYYKPGGGQSSPQSQTALPKIGDVRDGFRYKGGPPGDESSWVKVK